jgi:hypothetical protein
MLVPANEHFALQRWRTLKHKAFNYRNKLLYDNLLWEIGNSNLKTTLKELQVREVRGKIESA